MIVKKTTRKTASQKTARKTARKAAPRTKSVARNTARSRVASASAARRPAAKPGFVKRAVSKKAAPKSARPKQLITAVKVIKPSDPARRGMRAKAIQSKPDAFVPKGPKSVPPSSRSGPVGMPREGELAPDFVLHDQDGRAIQLSKLRGSPVVLYFYPKDDTPGCTIEAKGFSSDYAQFQKKGIVVLGVSKDSEKSHCDFRDKYGLKFPLLADPETKVIQMYGCWGEKTLYGRKYMGTTRATFVIAADGHIMKVFPNVNPEGHSKEILGIFR